jgi:hypothetical protein
MNVLYRNYNNVVEGVASGYDQTILTGAGVSLSKSGNQYIGLISGSARTATIKVSGKNNATGKTESLGTYTFRVSNLPPPSAYLGNLANGAVVEKSNLNAIQTIFAKYPPEIPLDATFDVASWTVTVSGAPKAEDGIGNKLTDKARALIAQAKSGATVTILVKYKGAIGGFTSTAIKVR